MGKWIWGIIFLVGGWYVYTTYHPEKLFMAKPPEDAVPIYKSDKKPAPIIMEGEFKRVQQNTSGKAQVYQKEDGYCVLRLSNFSTVYGPNIHVYMVEEDGATGAVTDSAFIDVGKLKEGPNRNYELPLSFDPSKYRSVSIYQKMMQKNYGAAVLEAPAQQ